MLGGFSSNLCFKITFFVLLFLNESYEYSIPVPTLEILSPKGFRVYIPDEPGIALFGFHGAINRKLNGIEPGDFEEDILRANNGHWIYENKNQILEPGDILYYWVHVQHNNLGYRLLDRSFLLSNESKVDNGLNEHSKIDKTLTKLVEKKTDEDISDVERLQLVDERLKLIENQRISNNSIENCIISKTTVNGRKVCSKALIFEENFDYFNWTKWERLIQIPSDSEDAEFVSYQDFPENCYITDGDLHIAPTLLKDAPGYSQESIRNGFINFGSRCTSTIDIDVTCKREAEFSRILPPIVSAKLRTKHFFSFRYGQVDIRAKLPIGDWIFPQLFLQPLHNEYGINGYASGQLRIAFIRGNSFLRTINNKEIDGRTLFGGPVLAVGEKFRDIWLKSKTLDEHFGSRFHKYTVVWDEHSITLALDGRAFATFQKGFKNLYDIYNITHAEKWEFGEKLAPFDKEFFLEIGVSAGGISDFPDGSRSGTQRKLKPWQNFNPKAELKFWNEISTWHSSWSYDKSALVIDYIKVWAI
ncbi:beta-1,3-glucan-binding protein-like [Condylostylus longicornis]|uniref:beta-1,3-glucan-binding protein-like n=1 Tax=Condylostylus longicornis TaxID=2530218 RepID=UPI00244E340D|nr:beta-1,3-glucan-binding protein-like [Condylostylus longicornis]